MVVKQVPFIGREDELRKVDTWIKSSLNCSLIFVHGDGGLGKTRFLQELRKIYINSHLFVTEIIDFDDRRYHISENIGEKIAKMLGEAHFESYLNALINYRKMEMECTNIETLKSELDKTDQIFINCFNRFSSMSKVILFIDTIEALSVSGYWDYLISMATHLNNCVVVIAGRYANKYGEALQDRIIGIDNIHMIELTPLKDDDTKEYLMRKQSMLHNRFDSEVLNKIAILSKGHPILIDLAVERLSRGIDSQWVNDISISENIKEFERELVIHIAQYRKDIDRLILLMAHVYPLNRKLISMFLNLNQTDADKLYSDLEKKCFIKCLSEDRIKLHDEMQRMMNEYVWEEADPEADLRRKYSQNAIQCFEFEIQLLTQKIEAIKKSKIRELFSNFLEKSWHIIQQRRVFKIEYLKHTLFLDVEGGFRLFINLFDEATLKPHFSLKDMLFVQMNKYINKLSNEQLYELRNRHAKHLLDRGDYTEAKEKVKDILNNIRISPAQKVDTLILLGNIKMRIGRHKDGVKNFEEAIPICEANKFDEKIKLIEMKSRNALGWGYRIIKKYDDAIRQYYLSLELSVILADKESEAKILNNLAYVYAMKGDTFKAHEVVEEAKELWMELDSEEGIGTVYHVYSAIYKQEDNLNRAIECLEEALKIFQKLEYTDWIERLCSELGKCYWERADSNLTNNNRRDVENDLNNGENILRKVSKGQYKIEALHYQGHINMTKYLIYRNSSFLDEAQKLFRQSHSVVVFY